MAAISPSDGAVDSHKPRRGRPPLLLKSAHNCGSLDRFIKPGSSSSVSTSSSSASANALASSENQNPNVASYHISSSSHHRSSNANTACHSKSEDIIVLDLDQNLRVQNRKAPISENTNAMSVNVVSSRTYAIIDPNCNSSPIPMSIADVNLNPTINGNLQNVPASEVTPMPKKAGRGRPRKKESVKPVSPAVNSASIPLSRDTEVQSAPRDALKMATKGVKRKRAIVTGPLDVESRTSLVEELKSEVASLIRFYHEDGKIDLTTARVKNAGRREEIALFLEESSLPFSSLIANLLLQLKASDVGEGGSDLTPVSLRSIVLSIGERISFGTPNPDADVLEDDSGACLWCWEVRDVKLLPEAFRNSVASRRRKRRKIAERIAALSGFITALTGTCDQDHNKSMLEKAEELLWRTENEDLIRAHVNQWQQKSSSKVAVRVEKVREKESIKEQHRFARETEKEQRRLDKEEKEKRRLEKEEEKKKLQQEKEKERLEKERERLEKEVSKQKSKEASKQEKELKKQQEEAEKEQKRKEKEEADLKRQSALKKQANIMGRFLQSKKDQVDSGSCLAGQMGVVPEPPSFSPSHHTVIHDMDLEMLHSAGKSVHDLLSFHLMDWKKHSLVSSRSMERWGQRRLPKMAPVKELRLQGGQANASGGAVESQSAATVGCKRSRNEDEDCELAAEKSEPEWDDSGVMDLSALLEQDVAMDSQKSSHFHNKRRKLLQFDKSHRPAYYGSFSKKSDAVRPRKPLGLDTNLDYENESDEEWEEEDPGESLSDCEKDEEDEKPDVDEDEEAGDGFLVPDGYLSESEGAHVEESDSESDAEQSQNEISEKVVLGSASRSEGSHSLLKLGRQRKALEQLTDHALRCNRPYLICNFHQNKSSIIQNTDRLCLEALRVCPLTNDIQIEVPQDPQLDKVDNGDKKSKHRTKKFLPETSLGEMVEVLMSSTCGLKRLVGLLSTKFPTAPRSLLKDKVKEIAEFVDNRWQVKKEILEQLGIPLLCAQVTISTEPVSKSPLQLKPITKFFSKRCLPPETAGLDDTSPIKGKESYYAKNDVGAGGAMSQSKPNSTPLQSNPIQSA